MANTSFISKIAGKILTFTKPDYMDNKESIDEFLSGRLKTDNNLAKGFFKSKMIGDVEVFDFGGEISDCAVIYIHGGAYVNEINLQHQIFCWYLARKTKVNVIAPVYPLAPKHDALETFDLILRLYENLSDNYSKIILMGDSAGGGFALSFSQYLKNNNIKMPHKIIVFSPWVDISMSNPPYDSENDPILGEIGLKQIGKSWAGDLKCDDYRVSPLFGNMSSHPKTLIFAGENEIFYKDILKYADKLKENDVDFRLITGEAMFHIYPLFPIPEAKGAFDELISEFQTD